MRIDRWFLPLAFLGLLASASPAFSADDDGEKSKVKLPKAVKKAVKAAYPEAKIVGTAKEKDEEGETVYEVELIVKGKTVDLLIDEEGEIEETEKEIDPSDLPKAVLKAVSKAFPKAKIEKAEEVTDDEDKVLYELAMIGKGQKAFEVVVVPNGKIMEAAEAEEDENDDKPKAKKKDMDDDEEDDKPKAKKKDMDDDDDEDDDKPKAKKKDMDDDDDEDDKPKAKKKAMDDDDDEDDDKPKAKKKDMDDDDDEDDDKPKAKKKDMDDDEDKDDEEDEKEEKSRKKPTE